MSRSTDIHCMVQCRLCTTNRIYATFPLTTCLSDYIIAPCHLRKIEFQSLPGGAKSVIHCRWFVLDPCHRILVVLVVSQELWPDRWELVSQVHQRWTAQRGLWSEDLRSTDLRYRRNHNLLQHPSGHDLSDRFLLDPVDPDDEQDQQGRSS